MRKIYAFLMSAVALVGFAACTEGLNDEGIRVEVNKEEVSIFASFDEDDTRMTLNDKTPVWEKGDVITINGFEFTAQESGTSVQFKGEVDASLIGAPFTAYYGGETVADEQVAREGDMPKNTPAMAEGNAFESGMTIEFINTAALLKFTPTFAGDITFDILDGEAITITGCEANKEYYVAVTPTTWEEGVVVSSNEILCKEGAKGQVIDRNKIYPLGTLDFKVYEKWGLVGQHQGWDITKPSNIYYTTTTNLYAVKNIKLADNGFKFAKHGLSNWNTSNTYFGAWKKSSGKSYFNFITEMSGGWYEVWLDNTGGQSENIGVTDWNATYDVYLRQATDYDHHIHYTVLPSGSVRQ